MFKMPKFGKFQFLGLKIDQKLVQEASFGSKISSASSIVVKKSVQQAPNLALIHSTGS